MKKKILQVNVVVGKGSGQFFVEKDVTISPPSPPIFKIEENDKKAFITSADVIPGKVMFNAVLWKNVIYKTVEDVCDGIVNGPIFHATFKVPFGGFVELDPVGCERAKEGDTAELLEACVEGQKDFLHCEDEIKGVTVFKKLLEKDVIKLTFKAVRVQHIPVSCDEDEEEEKEDKCEKKCEEKCDKWEVKCDKKWEDKCEDKHEDKHEDKCEKEEKHEEKWDKRYDCRGDYYAKCRGKV